MDGGIRKPGDALSGELWEKKKEQIQRSSAFGKLPGWDLRSVSYYYFSSLSSGELRVKLRKNFPLKKFYCSSVIQSIYRID